MNPFLLDKWKDFRKNQEIIAIIMTVIKKITVINFFYSSIRHCQNVIILDVFFLFLYFIFRLIADLDFLLMMLANLYS